MQHILWCMCTQGNVVMRVKVRRIQPALMLKGGVMRDQRSRTGRKAKHKGRKGYGN